MKFIGQYIQSFIARFRNDVYLEDISTGTIASGAHLGLDSNNKIVKAVDGGGDLTSIVAGTGLSGTSLTGPIPTLNVDASQTQITAVGTIGTGVWRGTAINATYLDGQSGTNTGDETLASINALDITEVGTISSGVWQGTAIASAYLDADTAHLTTAQTFTGSKTMATDVKLNFRDANSTINSPTANDLEIAATDITLDAAGSIFMEASDVTMFDPVNDGNPTISLGSSATNRFEIKSLYNSSAQTLDQVEFNSYTTSGTTNDGRYLFNVDEVLLAKLNDGGLNVFGNINANVDGATITAQNTTASSATEGGKLDLRSNDGAAMGDNHRLGVIEFKGAEDASGTYSTGARIQAICRDAWDGSNNDADLEFYTTDGTTESKVLTLDADKLATFAGAVTVTGALSGTLATVSQPNITGVGTITTGVWNGTAIATDQQKHLENFEFEGFSVGDGTNYMIPEINTDTKAPFEHQTSTGSDGLTATAVVRLLRTSGHVMPYAGTLKLWKGWATSSGSSQTVDIGLYKVTLVNDDADAVSPVVLKNTSFTSVGNTKALSFSETSFSVTFAAGDILISAIRNGTNNKKCEFTSTLVVEWD